MWERQLEEKKKDGENSLLVEEDPLQVFQLSKNAQV